MSSLFSFFPAILKKSYLKKFKSIKKKEKKKTTLRALLLFK